MSTKAKTAHAIDAIDLLMADHAEVKSLFEQYEGLGDRAGATKKKLADQICAELSKHAIAEEEIFYPAVRKAIGADDLMDEALVEHAAAKELIAQIQAMDPDDELYDATIKVLSEQIDHHVEEEESEMFPQARQTRLDMVKLGQQISARKDEVDVAPA